MKKIALTLIAAVTLCNSNSLFSASMESLNPVYQWTGFYIGANAGYWWSQTNKIITSGSPGFINPTFALGASNVANALARVANNKFWLDSYGFIGGGQVGYNYQYSNGIILGIDTDLDALTNSNNTFALQKVVRLVDFNENYVGSLSIKQKINFLGTLRARLGYLFHPTILVYATGGFAYGNVSLDTAWTAQESLGSSVFPAINTQNNVNKTLPGWTVGAGIEWLFKTHWSTKLEYTYYSLDNFNAPMTLRQTNGSLSPSIPWASATANTALSLSVGTVRLGINYHFA